MFLTTNVFLQMSEIARHTTDDILFYYDVISGCNFIISFLMTNGKIFEMINRFKKKKLRRGKAYFKHFFKKLLDILESLLITK